MIRIGVVNIDVSHPKAFSSYLMKGNRARYVAVFNDGFREDDEVEGFVKSANLEKRCASVEELAAMVDIGFIQGCNWDKHLAYAQPFIDLGKPVFIDKPMVGSMPDVRKVEELLAKGAKIIGSSSARYCYEIADFLAIPVETRGEIVHIQGTSGVDEFNYGVHIVEAIGGLMKNGALSCKFTGRAEVGGKSCESYLITYANGVTAEYALFIGTWQPFVITIMTTKTTYTFKVDSGKLYQAMLDRICDKLEGKEDTLAPIPDILESIKVMLAGKISRENGGKEVKLTEIPEDYRGYDGYEFEVGYAAAAKKIYLA